MANVKLNGVSKRYPQASELAVDSLNIEIEHGEFFILLGPSGCGKSTALRMIAGLESVTSGELSIGNKIVNSVPAKERDIAMVFQSYALYPHMTVARNLGFGLRRREVPVAEISKRVNAVAHMLGLTDLLGRKPHALSGGQRQRVALGRAIVRDPAVFLFDEPLSNLDAALRTAMRGELVELHRRIGTTMIYVTHDQVEAMTMGDRICIMNKGKLVQTGLPMEVYDTPADTFVAKFLGNPPMNLLRARLQMKEDAIVIRVGRQSMAFPGLRLSDFTGLIGADVIFGIRPEDVYERAPEHLRDHGVELRAKVNAVETLGAETLLDLDIEGVAETFCARVGRTSRARPGDVVDLCLDAAAVHLFEPANGRAIQHCRTNDYHGRLNIQTTLN